VHGSANDMLLKAAEYVLLDNTISLKTGHTGHTRAKREQMCRMLADNLIFKHGLGQDLSCEGVACMWHSP
jgi:hypothetical protein